MIRPFCRGVPEPREPGVNAVAARRKAETIGLPPIRRESNVPFDSPVSSTALGPRALGNSGNAYPHEREC